MKVQFESLGVIVKFMFRDLYKNPINGAVALTLVFSLVFFL